MRVVARPIADVACLEADADKELVAFGEGRRAAVRDDGEGLVLGCGVALVERVDPFLDPHARRIGQVAVVDVALSDRVGGRVDVECEGRDLVLVWVDEGVRAGILVRDVGVRCRADGLSWSEARRVMLWIGWTGLGIRRCPRGAGGTARRHEGESDQGQDWLAHGATSLRRAAKDSQPSWAGPTQRTRRSRSGRHQCAVGPPP